MSCEKIYSAAVPAAVSGAETGFDAQPESDVSIAAASSIVIVFFFMVISYQGSSF